MAGEEQNPNMPQQPMWAPYGYVPFGYNLQPSRSSHELQQQMMPQFMTPGRSAHDLQQAGIQQQGGMQQQAGMQQQGSMQQQGGMQPLMVPGRSSHDLQQEMMPSQEQMSMPVPMMNPMMNQSMIQNWMSGSPYGQMQFPQQMMMPAPQLPNQLNLAPQPDNEEQWEEAQRDAPQAGPNAGMQMMGSQIYPGGTWNQQGFQPMIYPMMMMVPCGQMQNAAPQASYPDVVEDGAQEEFIDAVSEFPADHGMAVRNNNVTPDLVKAATDAEPLYMNQQQNEPRLEQPCYQNEDISAHNVPPEPMEKLPPKSPKSKTHNNRFSKHHNRSNIRARSVHDLHESRVSHESTNLIRAKSVQPELSPELPLYQNEASNTLERPIDRAYNSFRTPKPARSQSRTRNFPLSRSVSTTSEFKMAPERLPTVLHIPDIKPRIRKNSNCTLPPSESTLPEAINSTLKGIKSKLGGSMWNLKNLFSTSSTNLTELPSPTFPPPPVHGIKPKRPPRRRVKDFENTTLPKNFKTANGSSGCDTDSKFIQEDVIQEVKTPVETPEPPRQPRVPMPGDSQPSSPMELPKVPHIKQPGTESTKAPTIPMPGIHRTISPVNALEMIGSPETMPRVKMPRGMSPTISDISAEPTVPMPRGTTPIESVPLRQIPGRNPPNVPQPMGSNKMRRSNRFSAVSGTSSTTPFHSAVSTGVFSLEDVEIGGLNVSGEKQSAAKTFQNNLSAAPPSFIINPPSVAVFTREEKEPSTASSRFQELRSSVDRNSVRGESNPPLDTSVNDVKERLKRAEQSRTPPNNDYDDVSINNDNDENHLSVTAEQQTTKSASPISDTAENVLTETRYDLLEGIRAMDDSIQTLKLEMSKLMSVSTYETVNIKPEDKVQVHELPDITLDKCNAEEIVIANPFKDFDKHSDISSTGVGITEEGQSVLEFVGDENVIKFKDYGGAPVCDSALGNTEELQQGANFHGAESVTESTYNVELGVYHENEISRQPTLSPMPDRKSFKNTRKQKNKAFRKTFLGIPQQISEDIPDPTNDETKADNVKTSLGNSERNPSEESDDYEDLTVSIDINMEKNKTVTEPPTNPDEDDEMKSPAMVTPDTTLDSGHYDSVPPPKSTSAVTDSSETWTTSSDTETLDVTLDLENVTCDMIGDTTLDVDATSVEENDDSLTIEEFLGSRETRKNDDSLTIEEFLGNRETPVNDANDEDKMFNSLISRNSGQTWEDLGGELGTDLPPPLLLQENIRSLKLDLLSSIFQGLYPTEGDCEMVKHFVSCPASLEEKYSMMRLSDLLKRNKKVGVSLESLSAAMCQLARIGQELMKPELERDPIWRTIPCAKEILVQKGIANRAPWEMIQGGTEILESLGYTEYTGFALQYPRNIIPDMFADHIGNLTVELVLASSEVKTLINRRQPSLRTLHLLLDVEPFPGMEPETYYPVVPFQQPPAEDPPRCSSALSNPTSALSNWIKKPSPPKGVDTEDSKEDIHKLLHLAVELSDEAFPGEEGKDYDLDRSSPSVEERPGMMHVDYENSKVPTASQIEEQFQNGRGSRVSETASSRAMMESEYEEIGPPKMRNGNPTSDTVAPSNCDLCGNRNPVVSCSDCLDQLYCVACDEMYHKHPKRSTHSRKSLRRDKSEDSKPYLPPKVAIPGSGPVAPPRRNSRKANHAGSGLRKSNESSPATPRVERFPRSDTLPRKHAGSMAGRPLPQPPPQEPKGPENNTPPPALPKKSASLAQMQTRMEGPTHKRTSSSSSTSSPAPFSQPAQYPGSRHQPGIPMPAGPKMAPTGNNPSNGVYPGGMGGYRGDQRNSQQPGLTAQNRYPNHHGSAQQISNSQYPTNSQYPHGNQYPPNTQNPANAHYPANPQYPANTQYPAGKSNQYPGAVQYPSNGQYPGSGAEDWQQQHKGFRGPQGPPGSQYHEAINFPPKNEIPEGPATLSRSTSQSNKNSGRGRFSNRVNRSSSLHNLARARMEPGMSDQNDGVKWRDEFSPNPNPPDTNLPGMNGFHRTTSTRSLNVNMMTPNGPNMMFPGNPMLGNRMGFGAQGQPMMAGHPIMAGHPMMAGGWGPMTGMMGPVGTDGINRSMHELNRNFRPSSPSGSQKSSRSKKSNRSNNSKRSKTFRHTREKDRSRTNSRNASRVSRKHRDSHRSESTDEDQDSEDFFTGESDEEFVSISSNSDKAPRVSWTCEHCTYVNNPGVRVCAMCCKTSKHSREVSDSKNTNSLKKDKNKSKKNYDSDDDKRKPRKRHDSREGNKKSSKGKGHKSPIRASRNSSDSDLDDAIATYYAVRLDKSNGMTINQQNGYEAVPNDSSSDAASAQNPMKRPNFDAPAPAKGILKKANSNPSLNKNEGMSDAGGTISELGYVTNKLTERLKARGNHDVLAPVHPKAQSEVSSDDIWQHEKENWMRQKEELKAWAKSQGNEPSQSPKVHREHDYMSDVASTPGRMGYRTMSGYSLADMELMGQAPQLPMRRASEVGGKKSFRNKRFSRNMDREPSLKRAQSFHMDQRLDGDEWLDSERRPFHKATSKTSLNSEHQIGPLSDSDPDEPTHFTSTVTSSTRGPGGIGSYLARKEFGSSEVQPGPDSGYVSHSSGGGYPKLQVPPQRPIQSFTMSVDRGFLGGPSKGPTMNPNMEFNQYRSMDDLAPTKTPEPKAPSLELVKLLREAEQSGFTSEDVQVAVNHCGEANPVTWLSENWSNMIDTVMTLASNVGHEANENTIGTISKPEAKDALRKHKGNIWAAVTECVEARQAKYDDLSSKGNFAREDIVTMLTIHEGNIDAAFQELNKLQLKPFLMRIWGQAEPADVASGSGSVTGAPEEEANTGSAQREDTEDFTDAPESVTGEGSVHSFKVGNNLKKPDPPAVEIAEKISPEQMKFERQVRRYLAEGKVKSYKEGELATKLVNQEYDEDEALIAAANCEDVDAAIEYLRPECELCANTMKLKEVINMINCDHKCCTECATNFFTIVIKDKSIGEAICPFCNEPSNLANDDDVALAYYAKLDIVLKNILDKDTHDLFQRKLRDRTLMKDPNFKWCYKCPFGFLADPKNKKLVCPDCRAMSCAKCLVPWETQHEGISCQDFAAWKEANDPDHQAEGLEKHLAEHGISCPACKFRYTLTKGGCMHFTCSQCKYEFCIGCDKPFKMGSKCGKDAACAKLGLHAHHPRNCLFYLRDKEPVDLQKLLKKNKTEYLTEANPEITECRVQVQKEIEDRMEDGICGELTPKGFGGYCKPHYVEYLCGLIFRHGIEVVDLLELGEIQAVFARAAKFLPKQRPGEYEFQYRKRLAQMVPAEIPLDST